MMREREKKNAVNYLSFLFSCPWWDFSSWTEASNSIELAFVESGVLFMSLILSTIRFLIMVTFCFTSWDFSNCSLFRLSTFQITIFINRYLSNVCLIVLLNPYTLKWFTLQITNVIRMHFSHMYASKCFWKLIYWDGLLFK